MTKELTVLAECVDIRTGTRFQRGDVFDPAPTFEQARRLIAAGCLPAEAEAAAEKADAEAEKRAEADKARAKKQAEAARKLTEARHAKDTADQSVEKARALVAQAGNDATKKAAADKALLEAEKAAKAAADDLAKLAS